VVAAIVSLSDAGGPGSRGDEVVHALRWLSTEARSGIARSLVTDDHRPEFVLDGVCRFV